MFVQVVEDDPCHRIALEDDDKAAAGARGRVVAYIGDALHTARVGEFGNLEGQVVRIHLIGQLGDDETDPSFGILFDRHHRTHRYRTAAGAVHAVDALVANDQAIGGEIRALNAHHERREEFVTPCVGMFERPLHTGDDFAKVVRRDVRGHADGDAGRAIDQQVRESRRKDRRFLGTAVVIGFEVDGFLVDFAHHFYRDRSQFALGISHGGRGVVARRTEVPLAGHHWRTHHPSLGKADQRVVDRGIAVWVILAHHITDDAAALGEAAVGAVAAVIHRIKHAAVHRFESVTHVWEGARHDDAHCVIDVGTLHLDLQFDRLDPVVLGRGCFSH